MAAGLRLEVAGDLIPCSSQIFPRFQEIAENWWPFLSKIEVRPRGLRNSEPSSGAAMFFTGGVDSFFTLKRNLETVELLVNVLGFDILLDEEERIQENVAQVDRVGRTLNKQIAYVSTNLRENELFQTVGWEITHLAAITAIAHSMSSQISTVFVASSDGPPPWGSE